MASVEIIPGEMRLWTDRASAVRPPAGGAADGAVLARLLAVGPGPVLVVGPHDDDVFGALEERDVTVLLRSLSDAEEHAAAHPTHRVVCGDLSAFTGSGWDLVVALDGVERVVSNDRPWMAWAARIRTLADLVGPGGRLFVSVDNPVGALSLADARLPAERRETGDWEPPADTDRSRPRSRVAAEAAFADLGLAGTAYAAGWLVTRPGCLVAPGVTDVRVRAGIMQDGSALATHELLFDPTGFVLDRLGEGRYDEASAGWVFVLSRAGLPSFPGAVLTDVSGSALELTNADLAEVRAGVLVADLAVELVQREDLVGLRSLMAGYLAWLDKAGQWSLPDATTVDGDSFAAVFAIAQEAAGSASALASVSLARRLLAPDVRRIWPPWMATEAVARTLATMAGVTLDPADVLAASTALPTLSYVPEDVRSLRALNAQMRAELASARGEVFAHERLAANRDRQLENRVVRLARAERKAEVATLRAERAESALLELNAKPSRRLGRVARNPRAAARALGARLRR